MTIDDLRAYERRLQELAHEEGLTNDQRKVLLAHHSEVVGLHMLSDSASLERDWPTVQKWFQSEWKRLEQELPEHWHAMKALIRPLAART